MHATLGIHRAVIVQPTVYGTDNRLMCEIVEGNPHYRGIAVIDDSVSDEALRRLNQAGVRGARFQLAGAPDLEMYERCIERIAPLGWHVKFGANGADLARHRVWLERIEVPMVIDHLGAPEVTQGIEGAEFQGMLKLLERGNCWILLSNGDRRSAGSAPWADAAPFVTAVVRAAPERALWASDWPHLLYAKSPVPNDGDLLDFLAQCVADDATLKKILVDNPARLYGFV